MLLVLPVDELLYIPNGISSAGHCMRKWPEKAPKMSCDFGIASTLDGRTSDFVRCSARLDSLVLPMPAPDIELKGPSSNVNAPISGAASE